MSDDAGILQGMTDAELAGLHAHLLRCVGTIGLVEPKPCEKLSSKVAWALRPGWQGRRTDLTVFGVCGMHLFHRQGWESDLREMGFGEWHAVPWDAVPELLEWFDSMGWLRRLVEQVA